MNIKRYDCSPGVDGYMSEDADGEYVRHEDIAAVLKDAERYRWLRKHATDTHANYRDVNGHLQSFDFDCEGDVELDAAIDAAMKGANT